MCNQKLKFGNLLNKAKRLGATKIATGHYSRIRHGEGDAKSVLYRAVDKAKDQSYFLFSLAEEQLRHTLLPLGGMTKPEVRAHAKKMGLKTYDKEESQEICFVPGNDYKDFLKSHLGEDSFHPGGIFNLRGSASASTRASSSTRSASARGSTSAAAPASPCTWWTSTPAARASSSAGTTNSSARSVSLTRPTGQRVNRTGRWRSPPRSATTSRK